VTGEAEQMIGQTFPTVISPLHIPFHPSWMTTVWEREREREKWWIAMERRSFSKVVVSGQRDWPAFWQNRAKMISTRPVSTVRITTILGRFPYRSLAPKPFVKNKWKSMMF